MFTRSIEFFEKAVNLSIKNVGIDHPDTLAIFEKICWEQLAHPPMDPSIAYFEKIMLNLDLPHTSKALPYMLAHLASLYNEADKAALAKQFLERALSMMQELFGPNDSQLEIVYRGLTASYFHLG
jgi:hypothetical protein